MQENTTKIIGVCVADISTDYNDRFFEAFKRLAHEFHFKVLFFSAFSPLYWDQKHLPIDRYRCIRWTDHVDDHDQK